MEWRGEGTHTALRQADWGRRGRKVQGSKELDGTKSTPNIKRGYDLKGKSRVTRLRSESQEGDECVVTCHRPAMTFSFKQAKTATPCLFRESKSHEGRLQSSHPKGGRESFLFLRDERETSFISVRKRNSLFVLVKRSVSHHLRLVQPEKKVSLDL